MLELVLFATLCMAIWFLLSTDQDSVASICVEVVGWAGASLFVVEVIMRLSISVGVR